MIQRIQTLYLLLAAASFATVLLLPDAGVETTAQSPGWLGPALLGAGGCCVLVALASIFFYADRNRQRSWILAGQYLSLVFLGIFFAGQYLAGRLTLAAEDGPVAARLLVLLLPVLGYAFLTLARRGVEKDIALVRSMDRLR